MPLPGRSQPPAVGLVAGPTRAPRPFTLRAPRGPHDHLHRRRDEALVAGPLRAPRFAQSAAHIAAAMQCRSRAAHSHPLLGLLRAPRGPHDHLRCGPHEGPTTIYIAAAMKLSLRAPRGPHDSPRALHTSPPRCNAAPGPLTATRCWARCGPHEGPTTIYVAGPTRAPRPFTSPPR